MRLLSTPFASSLLVPKDLRTRCWPDLLVRVIVDSEVESAYLPTTKFFSMISTGVIAHDVFGSATPSMAVKPKTSISAVPDFKLPALFT